jgi:hypothetical protein
METLRALRRERRRVGQRRLAVLLCALITTLLKLRIAATTAGTHDVSRFGLFAKLVHQMGPIAIYGTNFHKVFYNHPPLIGWFLVATNAIRTLGPSNRFLIRVPSSLSDVVTAWLIFELVRRGRSLNQATVAGLVVALSPVLLVISGFHGNTDPVFVMFILLSAYLVIRERPFSAGASAAIAVSIKIVPVVALPSLAIALWTNRRNLVRAAAGFLVVFVPLWAPVVARQWSGFKSSVLEYGGLNPKKTPWGFVDVARHLHQQELVDLMVGPGRFAAVAISALVPAYFVLKRRDLVAVGVGLSLALMLLMTTTFGTQYTAWAAAAALLLDVWGGLAYNLLCGLFLAVVYTHWANGFPWDSATPYALTTGQERLGWIVWIVLLTCVVLGIRRLYLESRSGTDTLDDTLDLECDDARLTELVV